MVLFSTDGPAPPRTYIFPETFHQDIAAACSECVIDCHDMACVAQLGEHCTDQCVIVACDDPSHGCVDGCDSRCDEVAHCPLEADQHHDYCSYPAPSHTKHTSSWDETLDAMLCSCGDSFPFVEASFCREASHGSDNYAYPSPVLSTPSGSSDASSSNRGVGPSPSVHEPATQLYQPSPRTPAPPDTTAPSAGTHTCMWSNCHANFASMSELVGHVNLQHLRIPSPPRSQPTYPPPNLKPVAEDLSCQWDNCHDYPTAQSIPGSSSSTSLDAALGVLADHLLHDHLGLQQQPQASPSTTLSFTDPLQNTSSLEEPPALEHVDQEDADGAASETSTCQWHDCGATFTGVDDLTAHINTVHVGGGKAHYECFWDGCNRSGDKGFASKQKICRHIQSHTGHRPFQCKLCKQYFSEAATLQQHMRRHTQEKPYLCDFPGCGKAFAIAGALTIHKRTHNGHKPFKCTYCDRGFSESSNLSKHLRTHTGVRPYTCVESGCVKSFSRPDQLARHMLVHKKKAAA